MTPNAHVTPARSWRSGRIAPLVLLLSFAIAVGMGLYALVSLRALLLEERGADLARTAARAADTLDRVLFERYGDIQLFANAKAVVEGTRDEQSEKLREYKKLYWYYSWIGVTDATGRIVAATDWFAKPDTGGATKDSAEGGLGVKQPDWFTKARSRGQVYLLEAQLSPESNGIMTVGFSAPIYGPQGDFRGVVTSRVPIENLRTILEEEGRLEYGEAHEWLLLDRRGVIIVETNQGETNQVRGGINLIEMELSSARRAFGERDRPGFVEELHQRRHIPVVTGYAATKGYRDFPGFDWVMLVRSDREHVYAPVNQLTWTVVGVGLLLITPLAGFGMWASWKVARDARDLLHAQQSLEESIAELARSNADLQQFAYVASHDLQEPLRMIASYTQLLAKRYKGKLDTDADDFIGYAVEGASRMQRLINDLLAYSRVTTQGKVFEQVDCNQILEDVLSNLQIAIKENRAVVTHDALPVVTADGGQLGQLFQNLIGNAIKFHGEEPPRVHVSVELRNNEWQFSVLDNGIGVDPQYAERIFVIFQRLHNREEYPGTGIGLAVCKKIVERHGGRIWMQSPIGRGSIFYFTLPVVGPGRHES